MADFIKIDESTQGDVWIDPNEVNYVQDNATVDRINVNGVNFSHNENLTNLLDELETLTGNAFVQFGTYYVNPKRVLSVNDTASTQVKFKGNNTVISLNATSYPPVDVLSDLGITVHEIN